MLTTVSTVTAEITATEIILQWGLKQPTRQVTGVLKKIHLPTELNHFAIMIILWAFLQSDLESVCCCHGDRSQPLASGRHQPQVKPCSLSAVLPLYSNRNWPMIFMNSLHDVLMSAYWISLCCSHLPFSDGSNTHRSYSKSVPPAWYIIHKCSKSNHGSAMIIPCSDLGFNPFWSLDDS